MYQIDFEKPERVHFIGIGGISMSGLAEILLDRHFPVSGSDSHKSELTAHLESLGAKVYYGQRAENITDDIRVVVYTAAIHPDNPEFAAAELRGFPMLTRAEFLGQVMKHYRNSIAVSGTHGKTTTTSMITEIFLAAQNDPTVSLGGMLDSIGGNIRVGGPDYFVMEACEYTNSFLSFFPTLAVILNVEPDHLDFFKDLADIRHSFHLFAQNVADDGTIVICGEIPEYQKITEGLKAEVVTYGHDRSFDYSAGDIVYDEFGRASYDLYVRGEKKGHIELGTIGEHNVMNSLAALAVAGKYGIPLETAAPALQKFSGTHRRFEKKGVLNGVTIIDDYAHHPHEIEATLRAALHYPHRKVWCIFQPHTYSRTAAFLDDFAKALSLADCVILADIYAARETNTFGVSSADIAGRLKKAGKEAWYFPTFVEIEDFVRENCIPGDLLITMGAGDIVKVGEELLRQ
ncbi:MAG: UDP-N-acetylmuramate--L-alanine ligase [Clostridium sp.]|nr:UDP-N-acetylmuramate--L-alanine ligase [Clostridium sp.]